MLLGALFFAIAGYVGVLLAGTVKAEPYEDGPIPSHAPVPWIVAGCAVIGMAVMHNVTDREQIVVFAMVLCALAAIWCTDVRYGIVPDVFTLTPLGLILLLALLRQEPWPFLHAAIPFAPFAATAAISKGRGLGWGDVKLAALGGAAVGAQIALLAFALSCLAAVAVAYIRGRRKEPIAFAPYLACAIAAGMPFGVLQ
jgi:prepilin signal peptidase PulO-like enzyme (type II secretory pathway)